MLVLFNLPVTESENIPSNWFDIIYYITLVVSSILSASLIVVVLILYGIVVNIIKFVGLGQTEHIVAEDEMENTEEENPGDI